MLSKDGAGKLTLHPNEKMVYNKKNNSMLIYSVDATRSAQWTIGKLCFVDASIEQIAKDLERKYDVKIKIESEKIKRELFSGSLNLNQPLKNILNYIDVDRKFEMTYIGKSIFIKSKY